MSEPVIIRELEFDAAKKLEAAGCVFIVQEEWEEGGDGGHSIIIGVYATVEEAFASHDDSVRQAKSMGKIVWANAEEDEDEGEWEVDVHIDALPLRGKALVVAAATVNKGRLLWETLGRQVEVKAVAIGVEAANAYMLANEKTSVINEVGSVILLAGSEDMGRRVLEVGEDVPRG